MLPSIHKKSFYFPFSYIYIFLKTLYSEKMYQCTNLQQKMLQTKTLIALISVISCIIYSSNSYRSVANYRKYSSHKYPLLQSTANSKYNAFEDEINLELLDKISKKPPKSFLTQFDESELINSMMAAGKQGQTYVL